MGPLNLFFHPTYSSIKQSSDFFSTSLTYYKLTDCSSDGSTHMQRCMYSFLPLSFKHTLTHASYKCLSFPPSPPVRRVWSCIDVPRVTFCWRKRKRERNFHSLNFSWYTVRKKFSLFLVFFFFLSTLSLSFFVPPCYSEMGKKFKLLLPLPLLFPTWLFIHVTQCTCVLLRFTG